MRNKITSLILSLIIIVSGFNALAIPMDIEGTKYENPVELLNKIGILDVSDNGSFRPDDKVTRAEFLAQAIHCLNISDMPLSKERYFIDVPNNMYGAKEINYAVKMGYVSGYGDEFRPNDNITTEAAIKIAVCMGGYKEYAEGKGGFPNGYLQTAQEMGLLRNISPKFGEGITKGESAVFLYNLLNADMMKLQSVGNFGGQYKVIAGHTLLKEAFDIIKIENILNGNSKTYLTGGGFLTNGKIKIGEMVFNTTENYDNYLGYKVTAFYKDKDDVKDIVLVMPSGKNHAISIDSKDIVSYQNGTYTYFQDMQLGIQQKAITIPEKDTIYNERAITTHYDESILTPKNGNVVLIDNNGDGDYDVVKVTSFVDYVVNGISVSDELVFDKNSKKPISFAKEDTDYIGILDSYGTNVDFKTLKEYDILSVCMSIDEKIISATLSRETVFGEVTGMEDNGEEKSFVINDKNYKLSDNTAKILVGDKGTFYLNHNGDVVTFKKEASKTKKVGYVIASIMHGTMAQKIQFKILNSAGKVEIINAADKITINENKQTADHNLAYKNLANGLNGKTPVVMYEQNADNEITKIYTAIEEENITEDTKLNLKRNTVTGALKYNNSTKSFAGKAEIDSDTVAFLVPEDIAIAEDKDFGVKRAVDCFEHFEVYPELELYSVDSEKICPDYIVKREASNLTIRAENTIMLVENVTKVVNKEGGDAHRIYGYKDGKSVAIETEDGEIAMKAVSYKCKEGKPTPEQLFEVEKGDVIRYASDAGGIVTMVQMIYNASEADYKKALQTANPEADFNAIFRIVFGNVYDKKQGRIMLTTDALPTADGKPLGADKLEIHKVDRVYICDRNDNFKVTVATINDIYDYKHFKLQYSKILSYTTDSHPRDIVIYK